ncbi:UbiD family decarboxylase [Salibacterium aidingense]|uniref:UbiD family decarboxylase n=1 Tax=Salibacterium aidingense TaxID=384933 RepID=UPI003BE535DA
MTTLGKKGAEQDMRHTMEELRKHHRLKQVYGEVSINYELPAVLEQMPDRSAVLFHNVKGYDTPVVGNLVDRENFAISAGISSDLSSTLKLITQGVEKPVRSKVVEDAPCRDVVKTDNINIMNEIPVNTFFEKEAGPYISAALITANDPETGKRNVSINRLLILKDDELMIGMSPSHHLYRLLEKAKEKEETLEVSISLGNHPITLVASNAYVTLGFDEYDIAGGMFGEPLELSAGVTVDVEAPARSEMVIEAEFIPGKFHEEGLVSEFHGMYVDYGKSPVLKVKGLTHRKEPYYQTIVPGRNHEHFIIGALAIESTTYLHVREAVSRVKHVHITEGGMGRVHCVISLSNPKPGEGQKAAFAAFAHCNLIKQVTIVDDDIEVMNPVDVEWAVAARMKAYRDVQVTPGVRADRAEPNEENGTVAKVMIIALKDGTHHPKAEIPEHIVHNVRQNWSSYDIREE